jgi:hypothetical protein
MHNTPGTTATALPQARRECTGAVPPSIFKLPTLLPLPLAIPPFGDCGEPTPRPPPARARPRRPEDAGRDARDGEAEVEADEGGEKPAVAEPELGLPVPELRLVCVPPRWVLVGDADPGRSRPVLLLLLLCFARKGDPKPSRELLEKEKEQARDAMAWKLGSYTGPTPSCACSQVRTLREKRVVAERGRCDVAGGPDRPSMFST